MTVLRHIFRALGVRGAPDAGHPTPAGVRLDLYLPRPGQGRVLVGSLSKEGEHFVFEYSKGFGQTHLPPLPDFPVVDRRYQSPALWPFFLVRLPPARRPDVRKVIEAKGLDPNDTFAILGTLGRRSVSSPYELEFAT